MRLEKHMTQMENALSDAAPLADFVHNTYLDPDEIIIL
jgi:hypothetical protein